MNIQAQIAALMVQAMNINARVEGLKAANQQWAAIGQGPQYTEDHFEGFAVDLTAIAQSLHVLAGVEL
jgi:hypothetical protein